MKLKMTNCNFQSVRAGGGHRNAASRFSRDRTRTRVPAFQDVNVIGRRRQVRGRHDDLHVCCHVQLPRTGGAAAGGQKEGDVTLQTERPTGPASTLPWRHCLQFERATRFFAEEGRSVDADDFFGMFETFLTSFAASRLELDRFAREKEVEEKRLQAEAQVRV